MPNFPRFNSFLLFVAALSLVACSPLTLVNGVVPDDGYVLTEGVAYGSLDRQRLDVYQPKDGQGAGAAPVIVFFYGGSWKGGERGQYAFVGEAFTRRGFAVVIADYRVFPEVTFPAFQADGAAAVRWTRDNIGRFGGDPDRIFLAGHSAGAHIAALLAVDGRYFEAAGVPPTSICGVAGVAGPYSFDPTQFDSVEAVFAGVADKDLTRPVALVSDRTPPFLLLHGDGDDTVYPKNSRDFARAIERVGRPVDMVLFPDIGHVRILLAMARPFEGVAPVNDRIAAFVDAHRDCAIPGAAKTR